MSIKKIKRLINCLETLEETNSEELEKIQKFAQYLRQNYKKALELTGIKFIEREPICLKYENETNIENEIVVDIKKFKKIYQKIYRKLALILHPDKQGTEKKMKKLNEIVENNNIYLLLKYASKYKIQFKETEEIIEDLKAQLKEKNTSYLMKTISTFPGYHIDDETINKFNELKEEKDRQILIENYFSKKGVNIDEENVEKTRVYVNIRFDDRKNEIYLLIYFNCCYLGEE